MDSRSAGLRPWLGGAILLGLVALMVVVAAVRGTVVAGEPVAPPVPDPPEPGHCLPQNPFDDEAGYVFHDQQLPPWRTSRCAGDRYGEVVTIADGVDLQSSFEDGSQERCWRGALRYLGLPDPTGDRGPDVNVLATLIGPDERQRAAGQDWAACVVLLAPVGTGNGLTVGHSLRDAWSRADDRRLLTMCVSDIHLLYLVDCLEPHGAEQISSWPGDPAGFGEVDVAACRRDAVDALGSSAPLDRGDLSAAAQPARWDERTGQQITGADAVSGAQPYFVTCLLVPADPSRMLVGPVRDLGDAPLPWG